jgi:hypothetical protein
MALPCGLTQGESDANMLSRTDNPYVESTISGFDGFIDWSSIPSFLNGSDGEDLAEILSRVPQCEPDCKRLPSHPDSRLF